MEQSRVEENQYTCRRFDGLRPLFYSLDAAVETGDGCEQWRLLIQTIFLIRSFETFDFLKHATFSRARSPRDGG